MTPGELRRSTHTAARLTLLIGGAAAMALAAAGAGVAAHAALPAARLLGAAALLPLARLGQLGWVHTRARLVPAQAPDPDTREEQPVDWWALLRAGFEVEEPGGALRDKSARLAGGPWRILRLGGLRIPVVRIAETRPLRAADRAELAACRHLIEAATGCRSPYGIALSGGGRWGTTVLPDADTRRLMRHALAEAREMLRSRTTERRGEPKPPSPERCRDCALGRPEPGTSYSLCGARFRWRPPHAVTRVGRS